MGQNQHESDDFAVSKLLRLKRYEQPPSEYFEKFLGEFQQRQRSELLRSPAWRIAIEQSLQSLRGLFTATQLSYAGASFAVLAIAGVVTFHILEHPGDSGSSIALNQSAPSQELTSNVQLAPSVVPPTQAREVAAVVQQFTLNPLDPQIRVPDTSRIVPGQIGATNLRPRYILDARPASYEPPSRF